MTTGRGETVETFADGMAFARERDITAPVPSAAAFHKKPLLVVGIVFSV